MQNNRQYFAITVEENGTLKKSYPQTVYTMTYQGIELFCYLASIGQWNVCEKYTGLPVAISQYSKINAFKQARERINKEGAAKVIADAELRKKALGQMDIYEEPEQIA